MTPAFQAHVDAIAARKVTKTTVIGLRKALNALEKGWEYKSATDREVDQAISDLARHKPVVTGDLHASGVKVLRNPRYARRWSDRQARIISGLNHFQLVGYDMQAHYATPIYRAIDANGDSFDFINPSWQSGGDGPEVVA